MEMKTKDFTISIPDNGLSDAGIDLIQAKLYEWINARIPNVWRGKGGRYAWEWIWKVGGKGEYVGSLPKRVAKYAYQELGKKLTPDQLSEIGNLATRHSLRDTTYFCDITDSFDWSDGDFGDHGSCYWSCHSYARTDMLPDNGSYAIRFWREENRDNGFARAWIIPHGDCYIVFNGYGMETLPIARVLSAHLGHAYYRRINFTNNGDPSGSLYINGGSAWLVGPQSSVVEIDAIDLNWEEGDSCYCCGESIDNDDHYHTPAGEGCCGGCYRDRYFFCETCCENYSIDDGMADPDGSDICDNCFDEKAFRCPSCDKPTWDKDGNEGPDGETYCSNCYCKRFSSCEDCSSDFSYDDLDENGRCEDCAVECEEKEEAAV